MSDKKKLFLVDAMALIYRAHFAFIKNPRINSKGMNTSSIFGFINSLIDVIENQKPTHIAVAFDTYEPTIRQTDYSEYKANRDKQPEDITMSLPIIKELLKAFQIPVLEIPGYEADDIIATLTVQVPENEFDVFMFTPDKDYAQLVKENVFLFKPSRMGKPSEIWDVAKVKEEFDIERIDQVVEIQGLMGDAVDNIPGVPNIGPVSAKKLIKEFDNIENLLANTDKLKGKVKDNLETYADQARMSKLLATLLTDAPISFDAKAYELSPWNHERIEEIFAELEFKNLGKRLLGKEPEKKAIENQSGEMASLFDFVQKDEVDFKTAKDFDIKYEEIESIDGFEKIVGNISKQNRFAFNMETTSSNPYSCKIKNVSFSIKPHEAFYFKFPRNDENYLSALKLLKPIFENPEIEKIGFDLKFIKLSLKQFDIHLTGKLYDNQLAHYIIDSESKHDFDYLVEKYLNYKLVEVGMLDTSEFKTQYSEKADINLQLFEIFEKELKEDYNQLFYEIESPLLEVLAEMEFAGVKLDVSVLTDYSKELENELQSLEKEIHGYAGVAFNINSPQQLGHILFDVLKLDPKAKKTQKSKQYSTGEEILLKLAHKHEIVQKVLDYRGVQKLKSTYVDALPLLVHEETGRIHTTFDQTVAATGRLSSKNPNLQNIPIRTERGRYTRKAFVARNDQYQLFSADYSQIELRVIAHTSNDKDMIEAFNQGLDIHTATAAKVFGVELSEVNSDMRRKAKEVNFGIIYGISSWGLSQRLGISRAEGSEIKEQYFIKYPDIKKYMDDCVKKAQEMGYAETLLKRRRYLRDINSRSAMQRAFAERNAVNAPIQGTAADLIKIAMVNIQEEIDKNNLESKMILQVHDELVFDVKKDELEKVQKIVKEKMESAIQLKVPLLVETGQGNNWLEAH